MVTLEGETDPLLIAEKERVCPTPLLFAKDLYQV